MCNVLKLYIEKKKENGEDRANEVRHFLSTPAYTREKSQEVVKTGYL